MKRFIIITFLWLCWGFTLGTVFLLGPLRWLVDYIRQTTKKEYLENASVIILIAILAITSFGLAYFSARLLTIRNPSTIKKIAIYAIPILAASCAVYVFLHPNLINAKTVNKVETVNTFFSVGTYPELEKMYQLKSMGYTTIVSLLHPAVVPFEPALLEKEKKNAKETGLDFISIPFLPWISENEKSIDSLRKLVKNAKGKYYIHCYLGMDRVNAATRIIKQESHAGIELEIKKNKNILLEKKFERGDVIELEKDVYLGPQFTKEEYFYVVGDFEQVVSLSNLSDPEIKLRVADEEKWLEPFKISFKVFNVNINTSKTGMLQIINQIKILPKPLLIHGFFSDDKPIVLFKTLYKESLKK